jgi:putative phosphoesterase
MRIAVLSDSHGALANISRALEIAQQVDLICFAGDGCRDIERFTPSHSCIMTEIVIGNCDLAGNYPPEVVFPAGGMRILMTHGHLYNVKSGYQRLVYRAEELQADAVIFGHTHVPEFARLGGIWLINPGSLSAARSFGKPSFAIMELKDGQIDVQPKTII